MEDTRLTEQVAINSPRASRDANCGNISSAMGPYAIEEGFVTATADETTVRVHIKVRTRDGLPRVPGDEHISGVPGTGSPLILDLHKLVGTHGKGPLPTGKPCDTIEFERGSIEFSAVDLANYIVFAKAESFGLSGIEDPDELSANEDLVKEFERFQLAVGVQLRFGDSVDDARVACSNSPFLALIFEPQH